MAATWLAVGKLVLTNLDTIVGVAKPLFTRRKVDSLPSQADLINQQILELQTASSSNAEQIKALAAQLQQIVAGLDEAALTVAGEREKTQKLVITSISISVLSLIGVIFLMVMR